MTRVKCIVQTCNHYAPGDLCDAGEIDILNEEEQLAEEIPQTMCKTFSKKSGLANVIGSLDNKNWSGMAAEVTMPGHQMDPQIMCNVEKCVFWEQGDVCVADAIEVRGQEANECQDTDCQTFQNREK